MNLLAAILICVAGALLHNIPYLAIGIFLVSLAMLSPVPTLGLFSHSIPDNSFSPRYRRQANWLD